MTVRRQRSPWLEGLGSLVFPPSCANCHSALTNSRAAFCERCLAEWSSDASAVCPRCASTVGQFSYLADGCPHCRDEGFHFEAVYRFGPYQDSLRAAVLRMKAPEQEPFATLFARHWAAWIAKQVPHKEFDAVVPVPLHWLRRWKRGYNQAEFLAAALADEIALPIWKCLKRVRRVADQKLLSGTERRRNLKSAFAVVSGIPLKDKRLLLVDDVLTSGATAEGCARLLKAAGAAKVSVAIAAKG